MFLRCPEALYPEKHYAAASALAAALVLILAAGARAGGLASGPAETGPPPPARVLHIAADPNNLPFSNRRLEGFENRIAELLARELNAKIEYTWWAQRRGFFRNTMKQGDCDLVMGVPRGFEMTLTTAPYYRSTYVFVYRRDRGIDIRSLDDPALRDLRVGVQMIGDDFANSPPAHALSARKIVRNVTGYTLYGDYSQENPPARIVDAVAKGEIDVAIVWGPLAGFFAKREPVDLAVVPVSPQVDGPSLPFVFDICLGVKKGNPRLRQELDAALVKKRPEIDRLLEEYGVPRAETALR